MFTTGLRYRTCSYQEQEIGGIFLWVVHREALSPVLDMEKAIGLPTGCTALLADAVHQLPNRNSTPEGMKALPRPSR